MIQLKFIRTTHDGNGRFRPFPPAAWQFWRTHGARVGVVLRSETPLTLPEIMVASQEYALEYPETGMGLALIEPYVAWCLFKLCEFGMVAIVMDPTAAEKLVH